MGHLLRGLPHGPSEAILFRRLCVAADEDASGPHLAHSADVQFLQRTVRSRLPLHHRSNDQKLQREVRPGFAIPTPGRTSPVARGAAVGGGRLGGLMPALVLLCSGRLLWLGWRWRVRWSRCGRSGCSWPPFTLGSLPCSVAAGFVLPRLRRCPCCGWGGCCLGVLPRPVVSEVCICAAPVVVGAVAVSGRLHGQLCQRSAFALPRR